MRKTNRRVVQKPVGKPKPVGTPKVSGDKGSVAPMPSRGVTPRRPDNRVVQKPVGKPRPIAAPKISGDKGSVAPMPSRGNVGTTGFKRRFGGIDSNMLAPSDMGGGPAGGVGFKKGGSVAKPGLYANIHAKKKRIAAGSGEKMRKVGSKGAPSKIDFIKSAKTAKRGR